jgi:hypothetical protein
MLLFQIKLKLNLKFKVMIPEVIINVEIGKKSIWPIIKYQNLKSKMIIPKMLI